MEDRKVVTIKVLMNDFLARQGLISGLATCGYPVWVAEEKVLASSNYFVYFDVPLEAVGDPHDRK